MKYVIYDITLLKQKKVKSFTFRVEKHKAVNSAANTGENLVIWGLAITF